MTLRCLFSHQKAPVRSPGASLPRSVPGGGFAKHASALQGENSQQRGCQLRSDSLLPGNASARCVLAFPLWYLLMLYLCPSLRALPGQGCCRGCTETSRDTHPGCERLNPGGLSQRMGFPEPAAFPPSLCNQLGLCLGNFLVSSPLISWAWAEPLPALLNAIFRPPRKPRT